jgi:hypothetical protein
VGGSRAKPGWAAAPVAKAARTAAMSVTAAEVSPLDGPNDALGSSAAGDGTPAGIRGLNETPRPRRARRKLLGGGEACLR